MMNWIFNKPHFSKAEKEKIKTAIAAAELQTSGEIRVFVENRCKAESPLDRAVQCFHKLKMEKTAEQNAVLFYIAMKDKKFAIIGDAGINKVVPQNFWDEEKNILQTHFSKGQIIDGLCQSIAVVGKQLQQYFPHKADDKNELSNEMVIG